MAFEQQLQRPTNVGKGLWPFPTNVFTGEKYLTVSPGFQDPAIAEINVK